MAYFTEALYVYRSYALQTAKRRRSSRNKELPGYGTMNENITGSSAACTPGSRENGLSS
ncbi:hypothetical protein ACJ7K1_29025 [Paenibacillus elgii]